MNTPDLVQKRFLFERKEFTIEENGVTVFAKHLVESSKQFIPFESIPPRPKEIATASRKLFFAVIFFTFFALVSTPLFFQKDGWEFALFMWLLCIPFWFGFFYGYRSCIIYKSEKHLLVLLKNKPSAVSVEEFLKKLFVQRNLFLLKTYGKFSDVDSFEIKMGRLEWLRVQEVIDAREFESKREELLRAAGRSTGPVGFSPQ